MMKVNEKYRKYRPDVPCRGNYREWWHYAFTSVLEEVVKPKRGFWPRIWEFRQRFKRYVALYKEHLGSSSDTDSLDVEIEECELLLTLKSVVIARREAERQYLLEVPNASVVEAPQPGGGEGGGIFSGIYNWWYGGGDNESESAKNTVTKARDAEQKWRDPGDTICHRII